MSSLRSLVARVQKSKLALSTFPKTYARVCYLIGYTLRASSGISCAPISTSCSFSKSSMSSTHEPKRPPDGSADDARVLKVGRTTTKAMSPTVPSTSHPNGFSSVPHPLPSERLSQALSANDHPFPPPPIARSARPPTRTRTPN